MGGFNMKMTRDQAIDQLVTDGIFEYCDVGNPAMEFYIKHTMEGEYVFDIDRAAWLNTLFGYDIGYENAREIDSYLYERDEEVCELEYTDKVKVKKIVDELGLNLDFSKWATSDVPCYKYF